MSCPSQSLPTLEPSSICFPSAPTQREVRGDLDLGLVPEVRSPCGPTAVSCVPGFAFARVSRGNSSCDAGGLSAGLVAKSLRNS
eukprot:10112761-Heterocapsa_arctica.AAC.1